MTTGGDVASRNWHALSTAQQVLVVRRLATRLRGGSCRQVLGQDVVGVGYGPRERARSLTQEVCLIARVARKWTKKETKLASEARVVRPSLVTSTTVDGKRVRVRVPVDVRAEGLLPTAGVRLESGRMASGGWAIRGTGAALVRRTGGTQLFVLSAYHVVRAANAAFEFSVNGRLLGPASVAAPFGQDVEDSIDAALIVVSENASWITDPEYWPVELNAIATSKATEAFVLSGDARLLTPQGPIGVEYAGTQMDLPIRYSDFGVVRQAELIECRATRRPVRGDSGSALCAGTMFAGMHIAGKGYSSFSVPSHILFSTAAFSPPLQLVNIHEGNV